MRNTTIMGKIGKWSGNLGDVSYLDYGGFWIRKVGARVYQTIELTNMDEACGRDNAGRARYVVELSLIDLDAIGEREIASALRCCGSEKHEIDDTERAYCCHQYGCKAPLGSYEGNNAGKLLREARSEAHALARNTDELDERMSRPVNAIGSTASEYMRGDLNAAMVRGVTDGRHDARIMAKMYGAPQQAIDDASNARPIDWMPYLMGYMDGQNDSHSTSDDLAPEYEQGFTRGKLVRDGKAVAPDWIKTAQR